MYQNPADSATRFLLLCFASSLLVRSELSAAGPPKIGIDERVAWTTSSISGSPEPPLPYVSEQVFPSLKFTNCLDIIAAPGSDRLFVVEQAGRIFSFPNDSDVSEPDLVLDLAQDIPGVRQVYALVFHPNFETNRYCYVCYIMDSNLEEGTHVARFRMDDTNPPTIDVNSETTIITWLSGGHNGCCLKFGHDGYLYITTGDGAPPNPPDSKRAGQDVSNLLSSILRIDVNHTDDGRNYRIPSDNPFVDLPSARGEIWAFGLRNPWRMSVDGVTGDMWVGDVGWELWEMLHHVERGSNFGWAVTEGPASTNPEWTRGPTPIVPPTIAHPHSESSSITDGLTYYGSRLEELRGTHIYGDYDTGKLWGFRYDHGKVIDHRELADTTNKIASFGEDHDGEMYFLDHPAGTIHRLIPNPQQDSSEEFPRRLSQTGLFSSVRKLTPAPGVIPYSINAEPWADFAVAQRHVAVPGKQSITPGAEKWTLPAGSVLVKTLSLDMQHGDPATRQRIETQILHFDGSEWNPYTYRWNEGQTDATLVEAASAERIIEVVDAQAPQGIRQQTWRFAGRAECQRCHNNWSGPPLAFNTAQLNRNHSYSDTPASQLDTYAHIQLISAPVPAESPRLASPHDTSATLEDRARAYLHTNCAHCHRLHAGGSVLSFMHADLPLDKTNMLNARPSQGTFGIHDVRVITPGDPFRSVLFYRVSKLGSGRMPRLGSTEVDRAGVSLLHDWLSQLPNDGSAESAAASNAVNLTILDELRVSESESKHSAILNRLLSSTAGALLLLQSVDRNELSASATSAAIQTGAGHDNPSVRDLFERFLAAEDRVKRLGSVVQPKQILSLTGDAERGRSLFFEADSVSCRNCHRIDRRGKEVGPDLTKIGKKLNRDQLLESILEPSKRIDQKYITYLAETSDGLVVTGLLVNRDDQEVILKDAQNRLQRVPAEKIEQLVPQQKSLMPDLLFRDMTAQQVADLLSYLGSLQ